MRFKCLGEGYNFLKLHNGSVFVLFFFFGEGKKKVVNRKPGVGKTEVSTLSNDLKHKYQSILSREDTVRHWTVQVWTHYSKCYSCSQDSGQVTPASSLLLKVNAEVTGSLGGGLWARERCFSWRKGGYTVCTIRWMSTEERREKNRVTNEKLTLLSDPD